jgi:hypothetical protein
LGESGERAKCSKFSYALALGESEATQCSNFFLPHCLPHPTLCNKLTSQNLLEINRKVSYIKECFGTLNNKKLLHNINIGSLAYSRVVNVTHCLLSIETENNKTPKSVPCTNFYIYLHYTIKLSFSSHVCLPHFVQNIFQLVEKMWTVLKWNSR